MMMEVLSLEQESDGVLKIVGRIHLGAAGGEGGGGCMGETYTHNYRNYIQWSQSERLKLQLHRLLQSHRQQEGGGVGGEELVGEGGVGGDGEREGEGGRQGLGER